VGGISKLKPRVICDVHASMQAGVAVMNAGDQTPA
jgi:hypothetical protein